MSSTVHNLTLAGRIKKPSYSTVATWLKNRGMKLMKILFEIPLNVVKFQQKLMAQKMIAYLIMISY